MAVTQHGEHPTMRALRAGIPLALLLDVVAHRRRGDSRDILQAETADTSWVAAT